MNLRSPINNEDLLKYTQDMKAQVIQESTSVSTLNSQESSFEKEAARRLLDAAEEIVNLMNTDYKGSNRPKPSINNHEPWH